MTLAVCRCLAGTELTPELIVEVIRDVAFHYFPQLAPGGVGDSH
jgi:hypothetical protein